MGPSKNTSKLPLIIKANKIQVKPSILPDSCFLNKGLRRKPRVKKRKKSFTLATQILDLSAVLVLAGSVMAVGLGE